MAVPLILQVAVWAYIAVAVVGLVMCIERHHATAQWLIWAGLFISAAFTLLQLVTTIPNTWVNVIWPRLQGGLFLAAMASGTRRRILLTAAPAALACWIFVLANGVTPISEASTEMAVFGAVAFMASRRRDPVLRWALLVYALPTLILSPALASLAIQQRWEAWLPLFETVQIGRVLGLAGLLYWLWQPRPLQLELWPEGI